MSWNSLKKLSTSRQSGGQPMKLNLEQIELEKQITLLNSLYDASKKLQKDAKKYTESIHEMSKSELKLTQDLSLSSLCHHNDALRTLLEEYHSVTTESQKTCNELILVLQKALLEPMKRYNAIFNGVQLALRKREQVMQEYQKHQARVEKLQRKEKTGTVVAKLEISKKDLIVAGDELTTQNRLLLQEIPQIVENRIKYFQPCLEATICSQVEYSGKFSSLLHDLVKSNLVEHSVPDQYYKQTMERRIAEIKSLSIVVDD